ncbi:protein phosphatase 2C domain-containing protein [Streptomyces sp. CA-288835]|uniref:protein phosphatase 2C domain-containing protein n=1 Tax=Streptomyces sp. CA-288835 TaxID=3240069 RepID=UPI003D8ECEA3
MSQQGETPTGHEDDWWRQLYDDSTEDTGPAAAADSLDDRFASAAGTVGVVPPQGPPGGGTPAKPSASGPPSSMPQPSAAEPSMPPGADALRRSGLQRQRAPWEAPPPEPPGPASFPPAPRRTPPGPKPPGFRTEASSSDTSTETPGAAPVASASAGAGRADAPADASYGIGAERVDTPTDASYGNGADRTDAPAGASYGNAADRVDTPADASYETGADRADPPADASYGYGDERAEAPTGGPATLIDAPSGAPSRAPSGAPSAVPADTPPQTPSDPTPDAPSAPSSDTPYAPRPSTPPTIDYVGSGPPTYDSEPTALPPADPDDLDDLVADTVLDGAHYGACTLRAASVRGDSARYRGEPRRDSLLTARFGTGEQALVLVAMATGARATPGAHLAAAEACQWIGRAVGRSHARLVEDIRAARRGDLKSGLHRLTDRSLGKLRATAAEQGVDPEEYTASLRCLLLPADPECRTRVFFGVGEGGLFRLRDGELQDIEPRVAETTGEAVVGFGSPPSETPEGDRLTMDLGIATPPSPYEPAPQPPRPPFRFRASVARPGDTLLLCTGGLAEPLRGEPELAHHLTDRWADTAPPGMAAFLADVQVRVKGYADDRTAAAVWEA